MRFRPRTPRELARLPWKRSLLLRRDEDRLRWPPFFIRRLFDLLIECFDRAPPRRLRSRRFSELLCLTPPPFDRVRDLEPARADKLRPLGAAKPLAFLVRPRCGAGASGAAAPEPRVGTLCGLLGFPLPPPGLPVCGMERSCSNLHLSPYEQ